MAVLCGLVLFARVYAEFPSVRWKIVEAARPSEQGSLAIDVPYVERLAATPGPVVVIARLENPSRNDVTINISFNAINSAGSIAELRDLIHTFFMTDRATRADLTAVSAMARDMVDVP